jgi:hypothetical protein
VQRAAIRSSLFNPFTPHCVCPLFQLPWQCDVVHSHHRPLLVFSLSHIWSAHNSADVSFLLHRHTNLLEIVRRKSFFEAVHSLDKQMYDISKAGCVFIFRHGEHRKSSYFFRSWSQMYNFSFRELATSNVEGFPMFRLTLQLPSLSLTIWSTWRHPNPRKRQSSWRWQLKCLTKR